MPMRVDCRHYESRTYPTGETIRRCALGLAPEAPWRCPVDCPSHQKRLGVGWTYGSLVSTPPPPEPELDEGALAALAEAAALLDEAGKGVLAEQAEADRRRAGKRSKRRKR
jgi:hypothetical protein